MKKPNSQKPGARRSRNPEERQRLIALWIFNIFLIFTVGLIGYGMWVSFA